MPSSETKKSSENTQSFQSLIKAFLSSESQPIDEFKVSDQESVGSIDKNENNKVQKLVEELLQLEPAELTKKLLEQSWYDCEREEVKAWGQVYGQGTNVKISQIQEIALYWWCDYLTKSCLKDLVNIDQIDEKKQKEFFEKTKVLYIIESLDTTVDSVSTSRSVYNKKDLDIARWLLEQRGQEQSVVAHQVANLWLKKQEDQKKNTQYIASMANQLNEIYFIFKANGPLVYHSLNDLVDNQYHDALKNMISEEIKKDIKKIKQSSLTVKDLISKHAIMSMYRIENFMEETRSDKALETVNKNIRECLDTLSIQNEPSDLVPLAHAIKLVNQVLRNPYQSFESSNSLQNINQINQEMQTLKYLKLIQLLHRAFEQKVLNQEMLQDKLTDVLDNLKKQINENKILWESLVEEHNIDWDLTAAPKCVQEALNQWIKMHNKDAWLNLFQPQELSGSLAWDLEWESKPEFVSADEKQLLCDPQKQSEWLARQAGYLNEYFNKLMTRHNAVLQLDEGMGDCQWVIHTVKEGITGGQKEQILDLVTLTLVLEYNIKDQMQRKYWGLKVENKSVEQVMQYECQQIIDSKIKKGIEIIEKNEKVIKWTDDNRMRIMQESNPYTNYTEGSLLTILLKIKERCASDLEEEIKALEKTKKSKKKKEKLQAYEVEKKENESVHWCQEKLLNYIDIPDNKSILIDLWVSEYVNNKENSDIYIDDDFEEIEKSFNLKSKVNNINQMVNELRKKQGLTVENMTPEMVVMAFDQMIPLYEKGISQAIKRENIDDLAYMSVLMQNAILNYMIDYQQELPRKLISSVSNTIYQQMQKQSNKKGLADIYDGDSLLAVLEKVKKKAKSIHDQEVLLKKVDTKSKKQIDNGRKNFKVSL